MQSAVEPASTDVYEFDYLTGQDFADLATTKSALVVIDMQRAFISDGAAYEVPGGRDIVPAVNRLVTVARDNGLPVIWVQADYTPPIGGLTSKKFPAVKEEKSLWRESPDFELFDGVISPERDEHRVVKHTYDAFYHTELEWLLRTLEVETVIICGVSSDVCCDTTTRSAYCRGFPAVFVSDASAAVAGPEFHLLTLRNIDTYFARVATVDEVEGELAAGT